MIIPFTWNNGRGHTAISQQNMGNMGNYDNKIWGKYGNFQTKYGLNMGILKKISTW